MSQDTTAIQFIRKLNESVKEYRKQLSDTRSDEDAAHFFNANLKSFLKNHTDELSVLGNMNFDRSFMSWIKNYLFKEKEKNV
jgi:alpha/beta superfamily hydrolase